jgi:FkbM family methyltransferase
MDIRNFITTRLGGHLFKKMVTSSAGIELLKEPVDGLDEKLRLILKQNIQFHPKYYTLIFFFTTTFVTKFKMCPFPWVDLCNSLVENYSEGEHNLNMKGIKLNIPKDTVAQSSFFFAFGDIILPHLTDNKKVLELFYDEGPYEAGSVKIAKGDTVIDCGANLGEFSAVAASKECNVIAFEPMAAPRKYLDITSKLNDGYITVAPCALSDKSGTVYFEESSTNLGGAHMSDKGVPVQMTTLDEYVEQNNLKSVDFIKADIEGAERLMLKGAQETIRRFRPKISICTYHLPDDPAVLRELILQACPDYVIEEKYKKMYAHVPERN